MMIPFNRFSARKTEKPAWHRYILWSLMGATVLALIIGIKLYMVLFGTAITLPADTYGHLYVRTGETLESIAEDMRKMGVHPRLREFKWVAHRKKLDQTLKPGHYVLTNGMSNFQLTRMLALGRQTPVRVIFHNIRTIGQLAGRIASQIEADSASLIKTFNDSVMLNKAGFNASTLPAMFIPNTYEVYWTLTPKEFFNRMHDEFNVFWDESRKKRCAEMGYSITQIVTLASIVEQETNKNSEKSTIAGVYINRLRKGMPLQADPTVKYAVGDFSLRRITGEHLTIDSPYNTYKYQGLPPGPICFPSIASVEAVLNYEDHGYYYFCARDDLSGYHEFARDYNTHMTNARRYQRALNALGIK
ncbi:MAG TPA: endolytic transglycosylase MltG [Bacteroidales bacterium]|nr:endolytic transglycosylase MltG [Bacteroidales bacterium]HBZ67097.1 endolytic transglycosylase MltG [Bacteroidales bacterium]